MVEIVGTEEVEGWRCGMPYAARSAARIIKNSKSIRRKFMRPPKNRMWFLS
jgi:hypothetical protein